MNARFVPAVVVLALLTLALRVPGCSSTVGDGQSVGTYSYVQRELNTTYARSIGEVFEAAKQAMEDLQIKVNSASQDALGGRIDATDASGDEITITLEATGGQTTEVSIQVGTLGNKNKTLRIYRQINANL